MLYIEGLVSELRTQGMLTTDVFICCASYEDRCWIVAKALNPSLIGRAIVVINNNILEYAKDNLSILKELFKDRLDTIYINQDDPLYTADNLTNALKSVELNRPMEYLIDITTFTHESLLILIKIMYLNTRKEDKINLIYTSASEYCPNADFPDKWLSKGVVDVRSVLGYPGQILPSKRTQLIILVGYEYERASTLIEMYEPESISLGHGITTGYPPRKHSEATKYFEELVDKTGARHGNVAHFEFSSHNPLEVKAAILNQVKMNSDYNHIVAPMSTKLSTIGSALAALEDETIQLCYAQAQSYNFLNYSSPSDKYYLFDLRALLKNE